MRKMRFSNLPQVTPKFSGHDARHTRAARLQNLPGSCSLAFPVSLTKCSVRLLSMAPRSADWRVAGQRLGQARVGIVVGSWD